MRFGLSMGSVLAAVLAVAVIGGCAKPTTYTKKTKTNDAREEAVIEALDCQKAGMLARRSARARLASSTTPESRQALAAAGRAAWERCLKARGWRQRA